MSALADFRATSVVGAIRAEDGRASSSDYRDKRIWSMSLDMALIPSYVFDHHKLDSIFKP